MARGEAHAQTAGAAQPPSAAPAAAASPANAQSTNAAPPAPRRIEQLPETTEGFPEVSSHEIKPESNPFTSRDLRMLAYAWAGMAVRVLIVLGGLFSAYQYMEAKEEKRVERTLQLVELWERAEYQGAQQAVARRLDALNERYAGLLGANPSPAERQVYLDQIGIEAMTADGGTMPLPEFRAEFGRVLYFLNRMAFCVEGKLCSRSMVDGYFGDYARSFWDYFSGHVALERKGGATSYAAPLEAFLKTVQPAAPAGSSAGPSTGR